MTINHIDQLTEWWENAEEGVARRGDALIGKAYDGRFMVYVADCDEEEPDDAVRVLARAPKPKPAWHDAPAIIATCTDSDGDEFTGVWTRDDDEYWWSEEGHTLHSDDLRNVTPLIEAKVTDEMVERAVDGASVWTSAMPNSLARAMLAAALGLDPA